MAKIAYILIGFPGSGKSSWAQKVKDAVIISRDGLRRMIYGKYDYRSKDEGFVSRLSEVCTEVATSEKRAVIIDDTNLVSARRILWIQVFKLRLEEEKYRVVYVWFSANRKTSWKRRCSADLRGFTAEYWKDVIDRMTFDPPSLKEGADEILTV